MQIVKVNGIVYLENTNPGHNKFYQMLMLNNGKIVCAYGKIGNIQGTTVYSERDWYKKLDDKRKKGYIINNTGKEFLPEIILNKVGYTLGESSFDFEKYKKVIQKIDNLLSNINELTIKFPTDDNLTKLFSDSHNIKSEVIQNQTFSKDQVQKLNEIYKYLKYTYY